MEIEQCRKCGDWVIRGVRKDARMKRIEIKVEYQTGGPDAEETAAAFRWLALNSPVDWAAGADDDSAA